MTHLDAILNELYLLRADQVEKLARTDAAIYHLTKPASKEEQNGSEEVTAGEPQPQQGLSEAGSDPEHAHTESARQEGPPLY